MKSYVLIHRNNAVDRMGRECCGGDVVIDFETTARHNNTPKGSGLRCKQRIIKVKADVRPDHTARWGKAR